MKIIEISFSESKTIQEDNYEPRNFHLSAKAEINETDDIHKAYKELKDIVKKELGIEQEKYIISKKSNQSKAF